MAGENVEIHDTDVPKPADVVASHLLYKKLNRREESTVETKSFFHEN